MAYIHTTDFESFQRLLGCDEVPQKIADEYLLWLTMFHKDGGSGPLGSLGVIAVLRACGFTPKVEKPADEPIDWYNVPRGQRVEARIDDHWLTGEYLGFGQHGILLVKLDTLAEIRECYPRAVKLSDAPKPEMKEVPVVEELPAEAAEVIPPAVETDWTQAEVGEEVWAPIQGEMQECKFTKLLPDEQIIVTFQGDNYTLPADKVIRAAVTV